MIGQAEVTTECGKAVFTDLVVNRMGSFTLLFTTEIGGQALTAQTTPFTITRGTAHHIAMSVEPAGFRPAQPFRVQPVVLVADIAGNLIDEGSDATRVITASLNHDLRSVDIGPASNLIRAASEGIVKYVDLALPERALGSSFSILFSSGEFLLPAHSRVFVVAEVASYLVVNQHTEGGVAIVPFAIQPEVEVKDRFGNLCTWYEGEGVVVVADLISPVGLLASMLGEKSQRAVDGKVFFTDLNIDKNAQGYRMVFRVTSGVANPERVAEATSRPFNVTFGAAYQLAFHPDFIPSGASPGDPLAVQPRVLVQDVVGNTVADAQVLVTATLLDLGRPAASGVLKGSLIRPSCPQPTPGVCDCSVNLGCGIAVWPPTGLGLRLDAVGDNYTIVFSSPGLVSVESFPGIEVRFGVVSALQISRQPWGLRLGENLRGLPAVRMLDKAGNFIPAEDIPVKVEMSVGGVCCYPPSVEVRSRNGVAEFSEIVISELPTSVTMRGGVVLPLGPEVRLRFSSIQAAEYVESVVLLAAREPVALNVTQQPGNAMPGIGLGTAPIVELKDSSFIRAGWYPDEPAQITATLCFNVPCVFGTYLDGVGTGQPCFRCTTDVDDECSLHPETPPLLRPFQIPLLGDVLSGPMEQVVHDGEALFSGIILGPVGTYRFKFTAPGFDALFSDPFTVFDGPIHHLAILSQPNSSVPLEPFAPQPLIELQDAGNNRATSDFSSIITASLRQLDGPAAAKLLPENPTTMGTQVQAQAGLAWFQGLRISSVGSFTVAFSSQQLPNVPEVNSEIVYIPVGKAEKPVVTALPDGCIFGSVCLVRPTVHIQDELGYSVRRWAGQLEAQVLSSTCVYSGDGGGWGQFAFGVTDGVASISEFSVALPSQSIDWRSACTGEFYLNVSGPGLKWTLSEPFLATLNPNQLAVLVNAPPSLPGAPFRIQPKVQVSDADGRWNRGAEHEVSVHLVKCDPASTDSADCTPVTDYPLIGTKSARAVGGVASFTNLRVDKADFCYRLAFSSTGLVGVQSAPLDITVGAIVVFFDIVVEPQQAVAGRAFAVQPSVAAMDAGKNRITGRNIQVAATLQLSGERTTLLRGARSQVNDDGMVTFTDLRIDRAGECNRLIFEGIGGRVAFSLSFTVSPAAPHKLVIARPLALPTPGWPFQQQPVLSVADVWGNVLTGSNCVEQCGLLAGTASAALVSRGLTDRWAQFGVLEGRSVVSFDSRAVAAYTDLQVNEAGGYDLTFTSSTGLQPVTAELIVPAASDRASRLKVLVEPDGIRSFSPFKVQPVVAIVDMSGNVIPSAFTNVTVSMMGGDVPGLIFYGTKTLSTVNGIVNFEGLQIGDEPAFSLYLQFAGGSSCTSSGGLCMETTTNIFDVAGAMAQISVEVPPPSIVIAGSAFDPQPSLSLLDASGRLYTWWNTYRDNITVVAVPNGTLSCNSSLTDSPNCVNNTVLPDPENAGVLLGANTTEYSRGLATFTDLRIDRIPTAEYGGPVRLLRFSVVAPSTEVFTLDYCCVTVVHGEPAVLVLASQPQGPRPGLAFVSPPILTAFDAFGNVADTSPTLTITATLRISGTLAAVDEYPSVGATTNTTVEGVSIMSTLGYARAGSGFSIVFSSAGLSSVETQPFVLAADTVPFELVLAVEPQGFGLNDEFRIQPVVETRDRGNNVVTCAGSVNVTLLGGAAVGARIVPEPNTEVILVGGVAAFSGLRVSQTGRGMQLEFGLVGSHLTVRSATFEVAKNATQLGVWTQPGTRGSFGGQVISPQPAVQLLDPQGFRSTNHTPQSVSVSLWQSGGPLPCPSATPLRCVLSGACASSFALCPVLEGQLTAEFVYGLATFTDLRIGGCNAPGENACFDVDYQFDFTASSSVVSTARSSTFVVNVGPASEMRIVRHHVASFPGFVFPTQPEIWVYDDGGNVVESYEELVTVSLEPALDCLLCTACPCTSTPEWFGETEVRAVRGRVSFAGLGIDTAGGQYRLRFAGPGGLSVTSFYFDLAVGPGETLRIVSQDADTTGGVDFSVAVEAIDRGGNRVPAQGGAVSAVVSRGAEGAGVLFGTTTRPFVSGVATFSALKLNKEASCYILSFTHPTLVGLESAPITVNIGPAESVVLVQQPSGFFAGKVFEVAPEVAIVDGGGNVVITARDRMEVWLLNNAGQRSPLCSWLLLGGPRCVTAVQAVAGRATFAGLHVDTAGTGYKLRFGKNRGGFQEAESQPFSIAVGPAVMLDLERAPQVATEAPGQPGYPLAVQPWVSVLDAGGNLVFGGGETVNAELWLDGKQANTLEVALWEQPFRLYNPLLPTAGAIQRSLNKIAVNGVAQFTNLQVDRVKQGFSIRFTSPGLAWAESAPFDIVLGAGYTVGVQRLPLGTRSGDPFVFQPVVHMQDRGRNRILMSPDFLMIAALVEEEGAGVLFPDKQALAPILGGVAVFTDLAIIGQGLHRMKFSTSALETDTTPYFNVSGDVFAIDTTMQPVAVFAGLQLATQPRVRITDDMAITVDADFTTVVNAELVSTSNPRRAVLLGDISVRCCWGQCLFTDLGVSKAGEAYVISFWAPGLVSVVSEPFEVLGPSRIAVSVNPEGGLTTQLLETQPIVRITDERGTLMTECQEQSCHMDSGAVVTAVIKDGTGGLPLAYLQGNQTAVVVDGIANFTDLSVFGAGRGFVEFGYVLVFSHVELYLAEAETFSVKYPPGPRAPIVYAKVLLFGIRRQRFGIPQQQVFRRVIARRATAEEIETTDEEVILLTAEERLNEPADAGAGRRSVANALSGLLRRRRLLADPEGLAVAFHVECATEEEALEVRELLEVMLLLDGELARELALDGLLIEGSLLLEGPTAYSADGQELFQPVTRDNTAGIVGAVVGVLLAIACGFGCYVSWWKARKRALIQSEDEDDLMWAIGVEYPKDDVDAALPWMAEKVLDKENRFVEEALSLRSISSKA